MMRADTKEPLLKLFQQYADSGADPLWAKTNGLNFETVLIVENWVANDIRVSRITPFEDGHSALMHSTLFIVAVEVLVSLELQVRASRKLSADSENSGDIWYAEGGQSYLMSTIDLKSQSHLGWYIYGGGYDQASNGDVANLKVTSKLVVWLVVVWRNHGFVLFVTTVCSPISFAGSVDSLLSPQSSESWNNRR